MISLKEYKFRIEFERREAEENDPYYKIKILKAELAAKDELIKEKDEDISRMNKTIEEMANEYDRMKQLYSEKTELSY